MGIIRVLLALSVVLYHTTPPTTPPEHPLVGGHVAVETFFIVSGFYMALVLNTKYPARDVAGRSTYLPFITARFLRLLPAYVVVLIAMLALVLVAPAFGSQSPFWPFFYKPEAARLGADVWLAFVLSHLTLLGQDWLMIFSIDPATGNLDAVKNTFISPLPAYRFLLVPQAWSLSVEMQFYLLAPLLLRRSVPFIISAAAVFMLLRVLLLFSPLPYDPWIYRLLPPNLPFFLAGALAYHAYQGIGKRGWYSPALGWGAFIVCLLSILLLEKVDFPGKLILDGKPVLDVSLGLYFILFGAFLPLVFRLTKDWAWDRALGELSYPLYTVHILAAVLVGRADSTTSVMGGRTVALSLLLAIAIHFLVERPFEKQRQRFIRERAGSVILPARAS